jgi:hypothetical protein
MTVAAFVFLVIVASVVVWAALVVIGGSDGDIR